MSKQPVIGIKKKGEITYIRFTQRRYNLPYYKVMSVEELISNHAALTSFVSKIHAFSGWEPATEEDYQAYNGTAPKAPEPKPEETPKEWTLEEAREAWTALMGRRPGNRSLATLLTDLEQSKN